jgi:hypothetical protein
VSCVDKYPPKVAELLTPERTAPLGPGTPNESVRQKLSDLAPSDIAGGRKPVDAEMAAACVSGLWLYHNFLDESHRISQEIETPTGSFWHGIMHRREGDFGNAKYWFRRVGPHSVFERLAERAESFLGEAAGSSASKSAGGRLAEVVAGGTWDPFRFVDLCQSAGSGQRNLAGDCERLQRLEWDLLFDFCYAAAVGERS